MPATLNRNKVTATHNTTHSPCTTTCTTHPVLLIPQPSTPKTTLLCSQVTNTMHSWQNGTRCRDGVKVLWCCSYLVWLLFEGSIPICACFHWENFFVTLYIHVVCVYIHIRSSCFCVQGKPWYLWVPETSHCCRQVFKCEYLCTWL